MKKLFSMFVAVMLFVSVAGNVNVNAFELFGITIGEINPIDLVGVYEGQQLPDNCEVKSITIEIITDNRGVFTAVYNRVNFWGEPVTEKANFNYRVNKDNIILDITNAFGVITESLVLKIRTGRNTAFINENGGEFLRIKK